MRALFSLSAKFAHHVLPAVMRPIRIVWNQVLGFIFLVFAVVAGGRAFRAWRHFDQSGDGLFELGLSVIFFCIMATFGISSFLRARKISRS